MPAASKAELPNTGNDVFVNHSADWGEMTIDFSSFPPHNLAPMLKGLPDDLCQCPHWGYLIKGRFVIRYADHEEMVEAGQAFYMAPGHAPEALENCEVLQVSPTAQMRETLAVMRRNMPAIQPPSA